MTGPSCKTEKVFFVVPTSPSLAAEWMANALSRMGSATLRRCCDAWDGLGSWAITSTRNGFRTAFSPVWVKLGEGGEVVCMVV